MNGPGGVPDAEFQSREPDEESRSAANRASELARTEKSILTAGYAVCSRYANIVCFAEAKNGMRTAIEFCCSLLASLALSAALARARSHGCSRSAI